MQASTRRPCVRPATAMPSAAPTDQPMLPYCWLHSYLFVCSGGAGGGEGGREAQDEGQESGGWRRQRGLPAVAALDSSATVPRWGASRRRQSRARERASPASLAALWQVQLLAVEDGVARLRHQQRGWLQLPLEVLKQGLPGALGEPH